MKRKIRVKKEKIIVIEPTFNFKIEVGKFVIDF